MNSDEKRQWEQDLHRRIRETRQRMLQIPPVLVALENRTVLTLTCPRGHRLFPAVLDLTTGDGMEESLDVVPLNDYGRESHAVTTNGTPFTSRRVCAAPVCPELIDYDGRCAAHGNRESIHLDDLATRFACRVKKCGYSERLNHDRLLRVVTAALVAGVTKFSVSGSCSARR